MIIGWEANRRREFRERGKRRGIQMFGFLNPETLQIDEKRLTERRLELTAEITFVDEQDLRHFIGGEFLHIKTFDRVDDLRFEAQTAVAFFGLSESGTLSVNESTLGLRIQPMARMHVLMYIDDLSTSFDEYKAD